MIINSIISPPLKQTCYKILRGSMTKLQLMWEHWKLWRIQVKEIFLVTFLHYWRPNRKLMSEDCELIKKVQGGQYGY